MDQADSQRETDLNTDTDLDFNDLARRLDQLWITSEQNPSEESSNASPAIARYQLKEVIGSGAFGVVYRAEDDQLKRQVALKLPRPEVLVDPEKRQRFAHEAELAARLKHPGIVSIYHAELGGPQPFIASDYCDGPDLAGWLAARKTQTAWQDCVELVIQVAEAVEHAHCHGVFHRDLKPANVLLAREPGQNDHESLDSFHPRITDFGLSKLADANMTDTRSSMLIGSPLYMAPEQIDRTIRTGNSAAADIYSLGVILYELLTGQPPISGETYVEVLDGIRSGRVLPIGKLRDGLPAQLQTICNRCLEKNPAARYVSVDGLIDDLRGCLQGKSVSASHHSIWDRLTWWCRRPQRVRGAAVFTICLQSIWLFWTIFTAVVGSSYEPVPAETYSTHTIQVLGVIIFVHGSLIYLGMETLRGSSWAPGWGLGCTLFHMIGFAISIVNGPVVFSELYEGRNLYYAFLIYCMLLFSFAVQAFLFGCAVAAQRARKEQCI